MSTMTYWNENWKDIEFDGISKEERYQISNTGDIRRYVKKYDRWKPLKSSLGKGYRLFSFKSDMDDKYRITKPVHKLVALHFCERPSEEHSFVIHLDFDKENNDYRNLKWVTRDEMYEHHRKNPNYRKGHRNYSKLTETEVIRIKLKLKRGKTKLYKIAKEFGITHTQLNRIRSGENWSTVKIPEHLDD
ncbi:MAG: hypothetical protein ACOC31_03365 [Bacteroidota bacterium]